MRIYKTEHGYHLVVMTDVTFSFTTFESDSMGLTLYSKGAYAGTINFERATEFYKAWRAMK